MNRSMAGYFGLVLISALSLTSCTSNERHVLRETPTSGDIRIAADESYQLLTEAERYTFTSLYSSAKIKTLCFSEDSILHLFLDDSVQIMITSRKLTPNETAYLKDKRLQPITTKIAYDALAFIVNRRNPDSLIRFNTIKDIFLGKISNWKQVNPSSNLGDISIVFDNPRSANVRFIKERLQISGSLPKYCYSTESSSEVINYVEKHPNALGIISVNWISDRQDSTSFSFLSRISTVAITSEYYSDGQDFYQPHPAYIADRLYPFIRDVYAINRETFSGLGSGFIMFVAGDQGQRIVLKSGMVPATMPVRIIHISKE